MIACDSGLVDTGASSSLTPKIHIIGLNLYELYMELAVELARASPDISRLTSELISEKSKPIAGRLFASLLDEFRYDLANPGIGMAVVDIPESPACDTTQNAFWGVA